MLENYRVTAELVVTQAVLSSIQLVHAESGAMIELLHQLHNSDVLFVSAFIVSSVAHPVNIRKCHIWPILDSQIPNGFSVSFTISCIKPVLKIISNMSTISKIDVSDCGTWILCFPHYSLLIQFFLRKV
jgi:hypothetical protein